jgi:hypothetical protein
MDAESKLTQAQARQADITAKLAALEDERARLEGERERIAYEHFVSGATGKSLPLKKVLERLDALPVERSAWQHEQNIALESVAQAEGEVRASRVERLVQLADDESELETACLEAIRLAGDALQAVVAKHQERAKLASELNLPCTWKPLALSSATQFHLLSGRDGRLKLNELTNASFERRRVASFSGNLPSATKAELADVMQV